MHTDQGNFDRHMDDRASFAVPSGGSIAGTVASLVFHLWLIATLATLTFDVREPLVPPAIESKFTKVEPVVEPEQEISYELANPRDKEYEVRKVVNASSVGLALSREPPTPRSAPAPQFDLAIPRPTPLTYDIPEGLELDDRLVTKGSTGNSVVQLESALDKVTWEIASHLRERKVLVVWLIDASASLIEQRKVISKRLHRIYGELGALEETGQVQARMDRGLLSAVVTFGLQTKFITPEPTEDFQKVFDAVTNAPTDASGRENTFAAVDQVVHRWGKYRTQNGRSILLITVTDETGDDFENLEPAISTCRRYGAKAYVIGPAAVFGRRQGFVPYVAPEDGKTYQLPVDLGPESFTLETVSLPFWFGGPQYEFLSSGLGPYALTRLVRETGGVYFMTNMTTTTGLAPLGVFTNEDMKAFQPDYSFGTPEAYIRDVNSHPLRRAVMVAAELSHKYKAKGTPDLDLRVRPENYLQRLSDAQKSVAETTLMIDTILQAFQGNLEAEYQKEKSARWRAEYNLAAGRLLAVKVRAFEYNFACAQLKQLGTGDIATKTNHWIFVPDPQTASGAQMKKLAAEADRLLRRVVTEALGTPWALLAARELKDPFGFRVIQRYIPPPKPQERPAAPPTPAKKVVQLANDNVKKPPAAPPKPPPPPPVLPKP